MLLTGERFVPGMEGNIELEHNHRYLFALKFSKGKTILDIACGEGYGSALLSSSAKKVIGIDISKETIDHAKNKYKSENLSFMVGDINLIPLKDNSVDLVVSFETIEHLDFHEKLILEIKRVLVPDGILIISSPDKINYSEKRNYVNLFHKLELTEEGFKNIIHKNFKNHSFFGQRVLFGSTIFCENLDSKLESFSKNKISPKLGLVNPEYWISIASDSDLPELYSGIYEQPIEESEFSLAQKDLNNKLLDSIKVYKREIISVKQKLNSQNLELERKHLNISHQLIAKEKEIELLRKSISWKITSPLRSILNLLISLKKKLTNGKKYLNLKLIRKDLEKHEEKKNLPPNIDSVTKKLIPKTKFDIIEEKFHNYEINEKIEPGIKVIAFYLPQFHSFPENDKWWGKGFTEWTNVKKGIPNFKGHYQPHVPIGYGYYDLTNAEVLRQQVLLAKNYGIHGFNFYYYWFNGKILMKKPFEIILENKDIKLNYCITWANENWTRSWDGGNNEILIEQNHSDQDSIDFIRELFKYFEDSRYIRISDKPVLIIYRANIIPEIKKTIEIWRNSAKEYGFKGLYLVCCQTFGLKSPIEFGFDAAMEFPPHTSISKEISNLEILNKSFSGKIFDYNEVVDNSISEKKPDFKVFKTPMLSWDNTARRQNKSSIFHNFTLIKYKQWLDFVCSQIFYDKKFEFDEKIVFINAWNEWAEGTHLEPDSKYGYGYLKSTYHVIKKYNKFFLDNFKGNIIKNNDYLVILHLHYIELWEEISTYLKNLVNKKFDLIITVTFFNKNIIEIILNEFPNAIFRIVENRGRDILPFINIFTEIKELNYKAICKIHSKKTEYRQDGKELRFKIFEGLLGSEKGINSILDKLSSNEDFGIYSPKSQVINHSSKNMTFDSELVRFLCDILDIEFNYSSFIAGTMFWFKPSALNGIDKIKAEFFSLEEGLVDGTLSHAVERIILLLMKKNNKTIITDIS